MGPATHKKKQAARETLAGDHGARVFPDPKSRPPPRGVLER